MGERGQRSPRGRLTCVCRAPRSDGTVGPPLRRCCRQRDRVTLARDVRSDPPLPAALDEFLGLIGPTNRDLSRAWFPSARIGREILSEGRDHARRTLEIVGLPEDGLDDAAFFLSEPSGSVAWVEMGAADDPAVRYIHEASTEAIVWTETFTEWLSRVMPTEDGELPPWT